VTRAADALGARDMASILFETSSRVKAIRRNPRIRQARTPSLPARLTP
jgi:hypothetical protein